MSSTEESAIIEPATPSGRVAAGPLRERVVRGSVIEIIGFVLNNLIRLLNNLILSRLLFPEAYGLTSIVNVFIQAVWMLTDVGIKDSVINSPRGEEQLFLNTAWTVQIVRGLFLWITCILVAYPISVIYKEPLLFKLIIVASSTLMIHSFMSTSVFTLWRHVRRGPLLIVELTSKLVAMIVMFVWAWLSPSVWALIAGSIVGIGVEVIGGHLIPVGYRNRLAWDPEAVRAIRSFGKWIFGSSAFTFLAGEGDRLLLGKFLDMGTLGVYSVATVLAWAVGIAVERLANSILYGALSEVARENREEMGRHYYAARLRLDFVSLPFLGALMVLGPWIVHILYDQRYQEAGWMLQILAARVALQCVCTPCGVFMITRGQPRRLMFGNAGRFVFVWVGIPVGFWLGGLRGVLWATVFSELPMLVVLWRGMLAEGALRFRRELLAPAALAIGGVFGFAVKLTIAPWLETLFQLLRRTLKGG